MPNEIAPVVADARYFFALWLPPQVSSQLHSFSGGVVGRCGGRLMREDALHITLAFLGEVAEHRVPQLQEVVAALELPKVVVRLDRVGFWNHNHVLWAGSKEPSPILEKLAVNLQEKLVEAGFLTEVKPFVPHVTLLRKLLHPGTLPENQVHEWTAEEFVLARSWPSDRGSAYEVAARWPLK